MGASLSNPNSIYEGEDEICEVALTMGMMEPHAVDQMNEQ
jgi:hypothetical protein